MGKRDRDRRPGRRAAFRDPKPLILVVCEGAVTEPQYLEGFRRQCRNPRVDIKIVPGSGVPKTIVETARELKKQAEKQAHREKDDNLRYDEVWCVFDIDEHPHVATARQTALDNDLRLAISNPCIELWLYLHFSEPPGQIDRKRLASKLRKFVAAYDKHVNCKVFLPQYAIAKTRAERLDRLAEQDEDAGRNPTTGFWRLTDSIQQGA
jgi:hypothetical protein